MKLTDSDRKYIVNHYLLYTAKEIGLLLGHPRSTIRSFLRSQGLMIPKELANKRKADAVRKSLAMQVHPEDDFITANYLTINVKQLATLINRSNSFVETRLRHLGLVIPPEIIQERIQSMRIKPGTIPANKGKKQIDYMSPEQISKTLKTRFKKGQLPKNTLYDGAIRVRHDHPKRKSGLITAYIRLRKGKWQELQRYNWEKVNGLIPEGGVLACKTSDRLNCDPSNWDLIDKAGNMLRNTIHRYPEEVKSIIRLTARVKKVLKQKQNEIR